MVGPLENSSAIAKNFQGGTGFLRKGLIWCLHYLKTTESLFSVAFIQRQVMQRNFPKVGNVFGSFGRNCILRRRRRRSGENWHNMWFKDFKIFFNFENAWHSLVGLRHCDTGPSRKSKTRLLLLGVYSVISHHNINFGLLLLDMIMVTFLLTLLCNVVSSIYSLALIQRWQWNQKSISAPIWQ